MAYLENPAEVLIDAVLSAVFVALNWPLLAYADSLLFAGSGSASTVTVAAVATVIVMIVIWYDGRYTVD